MTLNLTRHERRWLRLAFDKLRTLYPTRVKLVFRRLKDVQGLCIGSMGRSSEQTIIVDPHTTFCHAMDTLIHEYAHALTLWWSADHTPLWGVVYAELLTKIEKWLEGERRGEHS
jgi:hypothetical protein